MYGREKQWGWTQHKTGHELHPVEWSWVTSARGPFYSSAYFCVDWERRLSVSSVTREYVLTVWLWQCAHSSVLLWLWCMSMCMRVSKCAHTRMKDSDWRVQSPHPYQSRADYWQTAQAFRVRRPEFQIQRLRWSWNLILGNLLNPYVPQLPHL